MRPRSAMKAALRRILRMPVRCSGIWEKRWKRRAIRSEKMWSTRWMLRRVNYIMKRRECTISGENGICRDAKEMIALYEDLAKRFPLVSIEDGLQEDDWEGWQSLTRRLGDGMQLVGDDLFVTNPKRIKVRHQIKCRKCGADKGESDRHADGGVGRHRDGAVCRLSHGDLPTVPGRRRMRLSRILRSR